MNILTSNDMTFQRTGRRKQQQEPIITKTLKRLLQPHGPLSWAGRSLWSKNKEKGEYVYGIEMIITLY